MCGIAGLSFADDVDIDAAAVARLLLAGLAERGQDATGYAFHDDTGHVVVHKDSKPLARFIEHLEMPAEARTAILHVREFTKGRPGLNDNNHPIRYGSVVGVHNGHIDNDDDLFAELGKDRSTPSITVDSEAIMMLVDTLGSAGPALERVHGSAAIAFIREDKPGRLTLAKRVSRPIWIGRRDGVLLFASTREPLELAARAMRKRLHFEEFRDGTALEVAGGKIVGRSRFHVDRRYVGRPLVVYPELPDKHRLVRLAMASF